MIEACNKVLVGIVDKEPQSNSKQFQADLQTQGTVLYLNEMGLCGMKHKEAKVECQKKAPSNVQDLEQLATNEQSKIPVERVRNEFMFTQSDCFWFLIPTGVLPNINIAINFIHSISGILCGIIRD